MIDQPSSSRREARLQAEQQVGATTASMPRRARADRVASVLLVAAAVSVTLGGVALALGFPRPHTLLVYAAVALGGLGVLLALPRVLSSIPFDPTTPMPRRRSDD